MPKQFEWTKGQMYPRVPGYVETLEDAVALGFEARGLGRVIEEVAHVVTDEDLTDEQRDAVDEVKVKAADGKIRTRAMRRSPRAK